MSALAETVMRVDPAGRRFRISLTVTILSAFALVFVTVMGLTGVAAYREAMRAAVVSADREIADLTARTAARSAALVDPLYATVAVVAKLPDVSPGTGATITQTATAFLGVLVVLPQARAVSGASADGALLQVLNLDAMTANRRLAMKLPDGARFAVRAVALATAGQREETWRFLNSTGHVLEQRPIGPATDTRDEIWFRTGLNNDGIATTVLHMFPSLGVPGLTIVRRMPEGGVLGIDVGLNSLGSFLAEQRISPRASAFIIDDNGILLAHSDRAIAMSPGAAGQDPTWITIASSPDPIMREVWINYATGRLAPGRGVGLDVGGEVYLARVAPLDHIGSPRALVAVVAPAADFTGPIERARDRTAIMFLLGGAAGLGLIALIASRITRPLAALTREADAIRRFDLDRPMIVSSHITEVARLATTMQAMKGALHTFSVYVPKDLVRQLMGGDGTARLGGERRVLSVMFTDIVGFTTIADGMDADSDASHIRVFRADDPGADGCGRHDRQICRRRRDGVMERARTGRGPRCSRLSRGFALPGPVGQADAGIRSARVAGAADAVRGEHGRGNYRQRRLDRPHVLHGYRRHREHGVAPGGPEQAIWHADPGYRGNSRGGRNRFRVPAR